MATDKQKYPLNPMLLARARELRSDSAPTEKKLWRCLRNRQLNGYKFRRQHPLETFVADFYCAQVKLVAELDGDSHEDELAESDDQFRTRIMERSGRHVIRFWNHSVHRNLEGV